MALKPAKPALWRRGVRVVLRWLGTAIDPEATTKPASIVQKNLTAKVASFLPKHAEKWQ